MPTLYARFAAAIDTILATMEAEGVLPAGLPRTAITVEPPRDPAHGDLATNAALGACQAGVAPTPRALAALLDPRLAALDGVTGVSVAGRGFREPHARSAGLA